jgi:hypothetical protein
MSNLLEPYGSIDEVRSKLAEVRAKLDRYQLFTEHVIGDYPIGRRLRGQCKLSVEYKPGKGFRTVKTTTDKFGRWCNPKKGTYDDGAICVAVSPNGWAGWLRVGNRSVYLQRANGDCITLADSPGRCWSKPRREPHPYAIVVRDHLGNVIRRENEVLKADPAELCDAWDVWEAGVRALQATVRLTFEQNASVASAC